MIKKILQYIAAFTIRYPKAVALIYVAFAVVHIFAAQLYLLHGNVLHAICAMLTSFLYLLLAYLHGIPH